MVHKNVVLIGGLLVAASLCAQERNGNFIQQQAYNEMQRVANQVDVLQSNQDELATRLVKVEKSRNEVESLKAEIAALRASLEQLKREVASQRGEIVKDLSGRISKITAAQGGGNAPRKASGVPAVVGPHIEYTVAAGDTLSMIAEAYETSVAKIKEMNGLKNNNLRIGQKLKVPKPKK